jgi:hypothetical protein
MSGIKRALSRGRSPDEVTVDAPAKVDTSKSEAGTSDVESQGGEHLEKHYVPVLELFRSYWSGLILQCGYEACEYYGTSYNMHEITEVGGAA